MPAGRPRKPAALRRLEGNPGKRPLPPDPAPLPADGTPTDVGVVSLKVPEPPPMLSSLAQAEWRRLAPDLLKLGLLRGLDMPAFAARCETYATWLKCNKALSKGLTYRDKKGVARIRPEAKLRQDCLREIRAFDNQFGLNPAARAKVAHVTGERDGQGALPLPPPPPQQAAGATPPALEQIDDDQFFRGPPN